MSYHWLHWWLWHLSNRYWGIPCHSYYFENAKYSTWWNRQKETGEGQQAGAKLSAEQYVEPAVWSFCDLQTYEDHMDQTGSEIWFRWRWQKEIRCREVATVSDRGRQAYHGTSPCLQKLMCWSAERGHEDVQDSTSKCIDREISAILEWLPKSSET